QPGNVEVKGRPVQLCRDVDTDEHADDAPHHSHHSKLADDLVVVCQGLLHDAGPQVLKLAKDLGQNLPCMMLAQARVSPLDQSQQHYAAPRQKAAVSPEKRESSMEQRLIDLETRLAFQEDTLQQLNDVIVELRDQLDLLVQRVQVIEERLAGLEPTMFSSGEGE